jgi:hypothetical protein
MNIIKKQSESTLSKTDWKYIIQNKLNEHNQNIMKWILSKTNWMINLKTNWIEILKK